MSGGTGGIVVHALSSPAIDRNIAARVRGKAAWLAPDIGHSRTVDASGRVGSGPLTSRSAPLAGAFWRRNGGVPSEPFLQPDEESGPGSGPAPRFGDSSGRVLESGTGARVRIQRLRGPGMRVPTRGPPGRSGRMAEARSLPDGCSGDAWVSRNLSGTSPGTRRSTRRRPGERAEATARAPADRARAGEGPTLSRRARRRPCSCGTAPSEFLVGPGVPLLPRNDSPISGAPPIAGPVVGSRVSRRTEGLRRGVGSPFSSVRVNLGVCRPRAPLRVSRS
jgi:hypothetical protein